MKKFSLTLFLIIVLLVVGITLVSCYSENNQNQNETTTDDNEQNNNLNDNNTAIPEGYSTFSNEELSFAYPADWEKIDGSITYFISLDSSGNNINILFQEPIDDLSIITSDSYKNTIIQTFEAAGWEASQFQSELLTNQNNVAIAKTSCTITMGAKSARSIQFTFNTETKSYVITLTQFEVAEDTENLEEIIYDSIKLLK